MHAMENSALYSLFYYLFFVQMRSRDLNRDWFRRRLSFIYGKLYTQAFWNAYVFVSLYSEFIFVWQRMPIFKTVCTIYLRNIIFSVE